MDDFIIQRPKEAMPHHLFLKVLKFGSLSSSVLPLTSKHRFPVMADQMLGGELPSANSQGLWDRITPWHQIDRKLCNSLFTDLAEFGPKVQALTSEGILNGFKVHYYKCHQGDGKYQLRVVYPLSIDSQQMIHTEHIGWL
jgi:hypothetical protein